MEPYTGYLAVWAVVMIYSIWLTYRQMCFLREKVLRQRMVNLLWAVAERVDS